jgi:hypothetical protein
MKQSHCCSRARPIASDAGGRQACGGETIGDELQDRGVLGQHFAVVGAQRRNQAERVDREIVLAGGEHFLVGGIDLDHVGRTAGLGERDARGHGAGER